ncbi:hypothetical protein CLOSTASPAR_02380, partial [[Clostridium] asparagiforme DSM 15981]
MAGICESLGRAEYTGRSAASASRTVGQSHQKYQMVDCLRVSVRVPTVPS